MKFLNAVYAALALALCLWLGFQWKQAASAEPRTLLDSARRSMTGPELDFRRARLELDLALDAAESAQDKPLVEEVLTTRATLLRRTGGFVQARADLERVLTHFRPGSLAIESQLAAVDLDAGEVETALARASRVIAKDASQGDAWGVRAGALLKLAERKLASAREKAGMAGQGGAGTTTETLMRRIAVLDPLDASRARRVEEFLALFPPSERDSAREALEELDDASELFAQVPEALAESLRGYVRGEALQSFVVLLEDAGQREYAADFGLCLVRTPWLESYWPFLRDMMQRLVADGRIEAAAEVVPPDLGKRAAPDASFFGVWAEVLYRAERWRELVGIANHLRRAGEPDQRVTANFFLGMAQFRQSNLPEAREALERYVSREAIEPFPGTIALAWRTIAELRGKAGDASGELSALRRAIGASTDATEGVGSIWQRLAELEWNEAGLNRSIAVDDLAHALRLSPRAELPALEQLWRERGERVSINQRFDLEDEVASMRKRGITVPEGTRSSFELVRMAELCLAAGDLSTATGLARRALIAFPRLGPAQRVIAETYTAAGENDYALDAWRELLAIEGPSPLVLERVLELAELETGNTRRVELVQLDPEGLGRRWAAEDLRDRGETSEAVASLQRVPPQRLGDDGNLLLAQMLFDQGQFERSQAQLALLPGDVDVLARALPLALDIGVAKRDAAHIEALCKLLEARVKVDGEALIDCLDHMLAARLIDSARTLERALEARPKQRSGELFVRAAQIDLLSGDLDAAAENLERAFAYDESGAAELGFLLLAVERREWSRLPLAVRNVLDSGLAPSPVQYALCAALGERLAEAQAAVKSASTSDEDGPVWQLVSAGLASLGAQPAPLDPAFEARVREHGFGVAPSGAVERDPRRLFSRLLALGHPEWTAWAIADLSRADAAEKGALFPSYLASLGLAWLGDARAAEVRARALTRASPDFVAGWDLLERIVVEDVRRPDHPRLLRIVEERREALGDPETPTKELLLADARLAEQGGDLDAAIAAATRAVELDPRHAPSHRRLAQLHRKRRDWSAAISAFHASMEHSSGTESDTVPVREFLALCEEARRESGGALERVVRSEVEYLSTRFPTDPLPVLEQARIALRESADDPRGGRSRLWTILSEFRKRSGKVPLEHLRAGSAIEWASLIGTFDAEGAADLLESELAQTPFSVELWRAVSQASERTSSLDRAVEAAETAVRMLPDAATARSLARLSARRGDPIEEVQRRIDEAQRISGTVQEDRLLTLALAQALARGNATHLGEALVTLKRLWDTRDLAARPEEAAEIGTLYALALCRRSNANDRTLAVSVISETRPLARDPTQRNLLTALLGLSRFLGN